ncbi:MAG: FG-GAP repeat protein, partial [Bacteroidetes bacterium]|nr:FG-GAP repeat protein [Bacteroidota bacterium]
MKRTFLFLLIIQTSFHVFPQSWNLTQKSRSSDHDNGDNLGISVAINDTLFFAGAWWEDGDPFVSTSGAAYIYQKMPNGQWQQIQKLNSPNPEPLGYYGFSVAVDENYALIGAYNEDEGGTGNAGAVYAYRRGANHLWELEDRLIASDGQNGDLFGYSVAITGEYALIGAPENDYDENGGELKDGAGTAYMFKRQPDGKWNQLRKLIALDREEGDHFGKYLDIDNLGLVIGAFDADNGFSQFGVGKAYGGRCNDTLIFWGPDNITSSDLLAFSSSDKDNFENFGWDVAISGKWAVIGKSGESNQPGGGFGGNTGAAYFFYWDNGQWVEKQKVYASDFDQNSFFGRSIGIDGSVCVIGAGTARTDANGQNPKNGAGAAYVFELQPNGKWAEVGKIAGTQRNFNDLFGEAVDVSGTHIVVGAWQADSVGNEVFSDGGAVYVFERNEALEAKSLPVQSNLKLINHPLASGKLQFLNHGKMPLDLKIRVLTLQGQEVYTNDLQMYQSYVIDL